MAEPSRGKSEHRDTIADPGTAITKDHKLPEYSGQPQAAGSKSTKVVNEVLSGPGDTAEPGDESSPETDSDAK